MWPRAAAGLQRVGTRATWLGLAVLLLAVPAAAQVPLSQDAPGGTRLRDRYKAPQSSQKLDENLRKFRSDDPEERLEAIKGLGELNDPKGLEYVVAAASDPDPRIRVKAIDTLGNIHAKDATPLLVQQLFMRDTDIPTKQRILVALGKIGDTRATKPIIDFLSRDVDQATRGNAIYALGDIGDTTALKPLETLAHDAPEEAHRRLANEAIRKIREKPEPPVVLPALAVDKREAPQATP
jgi:HEAT repeat protein